MDLAIIPECYIDTNLVETLVPPVGKGYNHQHGCGTVTKVMKARLADGFAVGIIDKYKREVDYLQQFNILLSSGSLLLHKHKTRHHYIIQIAPAVKRMIFSNAAAANINTEDYDLPSNFEAVQKISKTQTSNKDNRFKKLFKVLKTAQAATFKNLEAWIRYLKYKTFLVSINELKAQ